MKIGVYGGSFNPVHGGHINLAETAVKSLELDKLFIVPVGKPWYKEDNNLISGEHRINMCDLAFKNVPNTEVLDYEINKTERNYTVSTIHWLKSHYANAEFYVIMGGDMFLTLKNWRCFDELKGMVKFCAAERSFGNDEEMTECKKYLEENGAEVKLIPLDIVEISSSEIRKSIEEGKKPEYLTDGVYSYIQQNKLYGYKDDYIYPFEEFKKLLKTKVEEKRYIHSVNVAECAGHLAEKYGYNVHMARTAGILHDICKRMDIDEQIKLIKASRVKWDELTFEKKKILHGLSAAEYIFNDLGVYNTDIIDAVRYHTTGRPAMTLLEKIVYVADAISAERDYPDVDVVREYAENDLDKAVAYIAYYTLDKLYKSRESITEITVTTFNYYCAN